MPYFEVTLYASLLKMSHKNSNDAVIFWTKLATHRKFEPCVNKDWQKIVVKKITQNVSFPFLNFSIFTSFCPIKKMTCLVTLFDRRPQVFKNSLKLTIFGILNELLSTRSMNVAHFARNCNVETFSVIFKHCVDKRPQFSILVNKNYRAIYDHYWLFF